jgi:hypothetical protein
MNECYQGLVEISKKGSLKTKAHILQQLPRSFSDNLNQRIFREAICDINELFIYLTEVVSKQDFILTSNKINAVSPLLILNGEVISKKGMTNKFQLFEEHIFASADMKLKFPLVYALLENQGDLIKFVPMVFNSIQKVGKHDRSLPREFIKQQKLNTRVQEKFMKTLETILMCAVVEKENLDKANDSITFFMLLLSQQKLSYSIWQSQQFKMKKVLENYH